MRVRRNRRANPIPRDFFQAQAIVRSHFCNRNDKIVKEWDIHSNTLKCKIYMVRYHIDKYKVPP